MIKSNLSKEQQAIVRWRQLSRQYRRNRDNIPNYGNTLGAKQIRAEISILNKKYDLRGDK